MPTVENNSSVAVCLGSQLHFNTTNSNYCGLINHKNQFNIRIYRQMKWISRG